MSVLCLFLLGITTPLEIGDWHLWLMIGLTVAYGEFRRMEK
jgi:hypothetical protein